MELEERKKLAMNFTDFINNNYDLVKGMYKLFKEGKTDLKLGDDVISLQSTNLNKIEKPKDNLELTMILMYISMKQLEKPKEKEIMITIDEFAEVIDYCNYLKITQKDFIKELER